ncbi:hypothetical protein [Microbaculum sp. FT89]|uniref:hypothetical protein n=1 Tax=Microbaculum sp. FT89 TaxID=3447298 RepID=UPI003F52CFE7
MLILAVAIASGVVANSAMAGGAKLASPLAGPCGLADAADVDAEAMTPDANRKAAFQETGGCDRMRAGGRVGDDGNCCSSICQTGAMIAPDLPVVRRQSRHRHGLLADRNWMPVPVAASERPPGIS